jgi:hypothetical protein
MVGEHGNSASRNHAMFGGAAGWLTERVAGVVQAPPLERVPEPGGYANVLLSPADGVGTCVSGGASAVVESVRGRVASSWTRTGGTHCTHATNYTSHTATVACGGSAFGTGGGVIKAVTAVYGDPTGGCAQPARNARCDWPGAQAFAERACIGKASCSINVSTLATLAAPTFSQWCTQQPTTLPPALHVVLTVTCSEPMGYDLNVTVPPGAQAIVAIPTLGLQNTSVTANGTTV